MHQAKKCVKRMESVATDQGKKIQDINHCKSIQKSNQGISMDMSTKKKNKLVPSPTNDEASKVK